MRGGVIYKERETVRQRDRETERQRDRERQRERQTERERGERERKKLSVHIEILKKKLEFPIRRS